MIGRSSFLAALLLLHSLPAAAQLSDDSAEMQHFFPLFVDGGGFRSRLLLSNAAGAANRCMLDLRGAGLDADVFEANPALTPAGASVDISLPADAGAALVGRGEQPLAFGYAQLECAGPVVARLLLTAGEDGAINGMTVLESEPRAAAFRFPVLPQFGPLGLVVSNAGSSAAVCTVGLDGNSGGAIDIAAESAQVRFLDELFDVPADFDGGSATVNCDNAVSMAVLQLSGGAFAAMHPAVQAYITGRANVPDAALRTALASALGRDDAGEAPELTAEELENLLLLDAPERGIVSLAGLESAVKLRELYLWENEISDISALAGLIALETLFMQDNDIGNIAALTGLTKLTEVNLSGNPLDDESVNTHIPALRERGVTVVYP